ncbi:MAG TPA: GNAT family N-acetyltransferase [Gaiellaceae bacterium]
MACLSSVVETEIRPFRPEDADPAYELVAEHERELFGEPELTFGMFSNLLAIADASYVAEMPAGLAGSAHIRAGGIDVLVRPSERRRGIGTQLLRRVEEDARGEVLRLVTVTLEPAAAPFCLANGYEKAWEVWLMGIDLGDSLPPPRWPEDVIVRTFREQEAAEVKDLLDVAYAQEPHHRPLPFEDWKTFMLGDPSFDPSCWFLAEADGELVAAALNWKEGYVKDLVVHPEHRRRGLGEALMLHTFREFRRRGASRVTLKTDSINPTEAWRLYERLGMGYERTYEVFEKRP